MSRVRAVARDAQTRCRRGSSIVRLGGGGSPRGQSAVEFALTLPVFFLLIFTVMDFGRMFFVQENIQRAIAEGARYASTGNHQNGTDPSTGKAYTRLASIQNYVNQQASIPISMGASLSSLQVSSVQGGAGSAGGPQDIETISITTNVPLMTPFVSRFFPNKQYTFTASATVRNEPFPPNQTK
jgi:Flp pilus assembly protein TadG